MQIQFKNLPKIDTINCADAESLVNIYLENLDTLEYLLLPLNEKSIKSLYLIQLPKLNRIDNNKCSELIAFHVSNVNNSHELDLSLSSISIQRIHDQENQSCSFAYSDRVDEQTP
jgi:hypothetical protein